MREIKGIFFWLSGVFTQPYTAILAQALSQVCERPVNPFALPNYKTQVEGLITGRVDDLTFCQALCESARVKESPAALRDRVLEGVTPNPGAIAAARLLPPSIQRWLVVDLPQGWFERISGRLMVGACFTPEQMIYLPASRLPRLMPEVFYLLASQAHLSIQECLLIDASARRAVQALKHDLSTELYVDNRRLERMFVMHGFIDRPQPVHKPANSL